MPTLFVIHGEDGMSTLDSNNVRAEKVKVTAHALIVCGSRIDGFDVCA